jgi:hypothetical protein
LRRCVLDNSNGVSVLFLLVAVLLMVTMGYVLTYLLPVKQKSVIFPIHSNQALYIAQSGVEYAVRYGSDRGWRGTIDSGVYDLTHLNDTVPVVVNQRSLGNGRFTVNYSNLTNTLTSTGDVTPGTARRIVRVSNFTQFLRLIFDPASPAPQWASGYSNLRAQFSFTNVRGDPVTLTGFAASWTQTGAARSVTRIDMNGVQKYSGTYNSDADLFPAVPFNLGGNSQTVTPGQVVDILVYWNNNVANGANILLKFFTAAGDGYAFNLDSQGNGL